MGDLLLNRMQNSANFLLKGAAGGWLAPDPDSDPGAAVSTSWSSLLMASMTGHV